MADHPLLIRIGDCPRLQLAHRRECFLSKRLHFLEEIIREPHPADVDGKSEIAVVQEILLETLPEGGGSHCANDAKTAQY